LGKVKKSALIEDGETVDTPAFESIAKFPAVRRLTRAGPKATADGAPLRMDYRGK
jgi:hypothetical protein